jgi:hypothetical protein
MAGGRLPASALHPLERDDRRCRGTAQPKGFFDGPDLSRTLGNDRAVNPCGQINAAPPDGKGVQRDSCGDYRPSPKTISFAPFDDFVAS